MRWQRTLAWALGLVLAAAIFGLRGVSRLIESDVVAVSQDATQHFPGDRVEALIAYVDCGACELCRRNLAVWALGQLGDQRALSVLKKHYTGQPCDHSSNLCQRELKKAIRLLDGGVNITRVFRPRCAGTVALAGGNPQSSELCACAAVLSPKPNRINTVFDEYLSVK